MTSCYLIASSQGNDRFVVYRTRDDAVVRTVAVTTGRRADGCQEADGIEAAAVPLDRAFPHGLFVCQDGHNTAPGAAGNQNFKLVRLDDVTG